MKLSRQNPNIEDPIGEGREPNPDVDMPPGAANPTSDPPPIPPDQEPPPPIEEPPDQPGKTEDQPDPPPVGDPKPNEPTRLV